MAFLIIFAMWFGFCCVIAWMYMDEREREFWRYKFDWFRW